MEILLLVVVLIVLFVILHRLSESRQSIISLEDNVNELKGELAKYARETAAKSTAIEKPAQQVVPAEAAPAEENLAKKIMTEWPRPYQPVQSPEVEKPVFEKPKTENVVFSIDETPIRTPSRPEQHVFTPPPPQESWFDKWLKDNPDIEKFIGENLINKIGIGILVLGIGFFVKYAIDQDWIKEIGRVCIGLFCGAVLIGLAHRLHKNYHSFSSVLAGGGMAVLYFTVALAFHEYHIPLFSQAGAFVSMIVITAFAVMLAILYDRIELAIIATVGGFLTPFLVSNGQGNYIVLFTYLCILNTGLIALAYYKRWRALNFIAFVFTQIIYIGWVINEQGGAAFPYYGTFVFGCVFYAMFVIMNVIHHVSRGSRLKAFDFIILLSVNLCFYGAGIALLAGWGMADYKGLFTASLGALNLVMGWLFFKQSKADKNFIYLIIGITVTYISLAAPMQLKGHYITLFWAAETVVLLWLYQRSFIKLLKIASALITALMIISLLMDWVQVYVRFFDTTSEALPIIANKGFITGLVCAAAMLASYTLLRREADMYYLPGFTNTFIRQFYLTSSVALLFCAGALETNFQFSNRLPGTGIQFIYLQLYVIAFFAILFFVADRMMQNINSTLRLVMPLLVFVLYVINIQNVYTAEKAMLASGNNKPHFLAEWISIVLLLVLAYGTIRYVQKNKQRLEKSVDTFTWITTVALLVIFSIEARHLFVWFWYSGTGSVEYAEKLYSKAVLSIVWGLSSFIIIWLGLTRKYKPLRVIALVVFGITLIKLFAYDIQDITPAGKIIAFILLGVVLLVVSFMYQRIKKIIIDDTHPSK